MKTLPDLIQEFRDKVEPAIGVTGLSNPSENISDPLVQIVMHHLGGLAELHKSLDDWKNGFDIRYVDCECLDTRAALMGEVRRTNQPTKVQIAFCGTNGTVIPANTEFTDSLTTVWRLDSAVTIQDGIGFGVASSPNGNYTPSEHELDIQSDIEGVSKAANGAILQEGYIEESCEQFRTRLLGQ